MKRDGIGIGSAAFQLHLDSDAEQRADAFAQELKAGRHGLGQRYQGRDVTVQQPIHPMDLRRGRPAFKGCGKGSAEDVGKQCRGR